MQHDATSRDRESYLVAWEERLETWERMLDARERHLNQKEFPGSAPHGERTVTCDWCQNMCSQSGWCYDAFGTRLKTGTSRDGRGNRNM